MTEEFEEEFMEVLMEVLKKQQWKSVDDNSATTSTAINV